MDSEHILTENGELCHWGIRGMRWGVRRYQNKDGSLTKAGARRYAEENAKLKAREKTIKNQERTKAKFTKLAAKKAELDAREEALKNTKNKKKVTNEEKKEFLQKSIKDMSDDEIRAYTNRMILEKNYHDAQKSLAAANPKKVSAGKKFVDGLMNDVVAPAAKNAGRAWLENTLKDKLGLNQEDSLTRLKKQYEKLDYEKKIEKLKNRVEDDELSWDERIKKQNYIQAQVKTAKAQEEYEDYLRNRRRTEQDDD